MTGSPLPTHTEDAQNPAVGTAAPVLRGAGFDGTPVTIGGDGRATLVMFLAHRCPHCQRELPVLASGRRPPFHQPAADDRGPVDRDPAPASRSTAASASA